MPAIPATFIAPACGPRTDFMLWIGLASLFVAVVLAYRCKCHSEIGPAEGIRLPENETGTPTPMDEKTSSQAAPVAAIRAQADADRCHQG